MKILITPVILVFLAANIYAADPESKSERNAISRKKASQIVSMYIKSEMTDFEKVLILHEYISDRVNYGKFNKKLMHILPQLLSRVVIYQLKYAPLPLPEKNKSSTPIEFSFLPEKNLPNSE